MAMNITVIGAGYVGLTTAVALAYLDHNVTCLDTDAAKLDVLRKGRTPIYEPYLDEMLALVRSRLRFTNSYPEAMAEADVIFIAVGTPSLADGSPDLSYVRSAALLIGEHVGDRLVVVVNKSTVPIGSGNWVEDLVRESYSRRTHKNSALKVGVASNPEFLREGSAIYDSLYPDRIVVGSDRKDVIEVMYNLYKPILEQSFAAPTFLSRPANFDVVPFITTALASSELVKYSANAFLSLKISFINEIAQLSERVGADITQVAKGIGLDDRIGSRFLQAGIGWGGSCFGKDTAALISTGSEYGLNMPIVRAARQVNYAQRERVIEKLLSELRILKGRTVGLLGLAFKPDTDDLRDAPAIDLAKRLIERDVRVRAHDPIALDRAKKEYGELDWTLCERPEDVATQADALVLVTEWADYRKLPWADMRGLVRQPIIVDGRNFLDRDLLQRLGFRYFGMGR